MTSKYITDYEFTDPSVEGDFSRDHVDNDEWSDRPDATRWFILPRPGRSLWVKVKRNVFGMLYISEVVRPLNVHHLPGYKYAVLPGSYKPYILNQWFAIVPEGSRGFHLTDDTQLWFFGLDSSMPGVELRDDKADVVSTIPALKRCRMNEALDEGFELGSTKADEDEVFRDVYLISGAPSVGKSTLVKAMNKVNVPAIDGDSFGKSHRRPRTLQQKYRRWMISEMDELETSVATGDAEEQDDAILDAFGIAALGLATMHTPYESYIRYVQAQEERDRPKHFWYDMLKQYLMLPPVVGKDTVFDVLRPRYDDSETEEPLIWDMDWILDETAIISTLEQGTSVAGVGQNIGELVRKVKAHKFPDDIRVHIVYLTCPFWVIRARLMERAAEYKKSQGDRYPHGIHDILWAEVMDEELDRQQLFHSFGATFVHDRGGRYTWSLVRNSVHLS